MKLGKSFFEFVEQLEVLKADYYGIESAKEIPGRTSEDVVGMIAEQEKIIREIAALVLDLE